MDIDMDPIFEDGWIDLDAIYRQTYYISCTLVGNKFVDHSDVVGTLVKLLITQM